MNKYYIALTFTIALLSACQSQTNQAEVKPAPSVASAQSITNTSIAREGSAQAVCGDPHPEGPVSFYPVSVEYSDRNLELVRKHFCEDARKIPSKSLGKDVLQVASFTSQERAEAFKEKLSPHFAQARVGDPTIVPSLAGPLDSKPKNTITSLQKLSRLTQEQFDQINNLRKEARIDRQGKDFKFRAILPKYIPDEFKLDSFNVTSKPGAINRGGWQGYNLIYSNQYNQCFALTVDTSQIGGPPEKHEEIKVNSEALGEVTLDYTDFDKGYSYAYIKLGRIPDNLNYQSTKYYFYSHAGSYPRDNPKECKRIDLQIAAKIVENLVVLED
jgi:hypothetical protein